jgi:Predicted xylanase/chitin deacetylase
MQFGDTPDKRALIKQEADDGHTIGVHSWSHSYPICYTSEQACLDDFNKMANAIKEITGITPNVNRFPGGTDNTVSMTYSHEILMPTVEKDVVALGYKTFDWNAGGEDADDNADPDKPKTSDEFVQKILRDAGGQKKLVILMHDTYSLSVDAVPELVQDLRNQGYTFETLSPSAPTCIHPFAKPRSGLKDASSNSVTATEDEKTE